MCKSREGPADQARAWSILVAACFLLAACTSGFRDSQPCDTRCQAQANYKQGTAYYDRGAYRRALAYFDEAARLDPELAGAHNYRAWILYLGGQNEAALPSAERAASLRPDNPNYLGTKAHVLAALGHWVDALDTFEQGMALGDSAWIRRYQQALADRGYYAGSIDGDYDADTRAAMENCLKAACRLIR